MGTPGGESEVVGILAVDDEGRLVELEQAAVGADDELVLVAAPGGVVVVVNPPH